MSILFGEQKSSDLETFGRQNALLILPVGQTEEHGPHLPLNTDTLIARSVAAAVGKRLAAETPTLVMDAICYGYSSSALKRWPGTIILKPETVIHVICETCTSVIEMGFKRIAIFSTHGNHVGIMRVAARKIADATNTYPAVVFPLELGKAKFLQVAKAGPEGSCHGGEYETSLMLHLAPQLVKMDAAVNPNPLKKTSRFAGKVFWSTWGREECVNGFYGDPTVASAETGKAAFEAIVGETIEFLREFCRETSS